MTGVGGRPEVMIEGSDSLNGGWREYEFFYKPGNLKRRPPYVGRLHFPQHLVLDSNISLFSVLLSVIKKSDLTQNNF